MELLALYLLSQFGRANTYVHLKCLLFGWLRDSYHYIIYNIFQCFYILDNFIPWLNLLLAVTPLPGSTWLMICKLDQFLKTNKRELEMLRRGMFWGPIRTLLFQFMLIPMASRFHTYGSVEFVNFFSLTVSSSDSSSSCSWISEINSLPSMSPPRYKLKITLQKNASLIYLN